MKQSPESPETPDEQDTTDTTAPRTWNGVRQKPFPKNAPADAITIAQLHAFLEEQMRKGYGLYPVMWSAANTFGYVRLLDSSCEDVGEYHRGVTVQDR